MQSMQYPNPIEMMRCERRAMTLSKPGCARLWESANGAKAPEPWEARSACRGCAVGATSAGRTIRAVDTAADVWSVICCRCLQPASRLISATFCVSCYNRQREAIVGRNAKGTRPALSDRLFCARFAVGQGKGVRVVVRPHVTTAAEAMIQTAKTNSARGALAFGRCRVQWGDAVGQMELGVATPPRRLTHRSTPCQPRRRVDFSPAGQGVLFAWWHSGAEMRIAA
jgi:hypothetical protein